jgi:hypothetical protein
MDRRNLDHEIARLDPAHRIAELERLVQTLRAQRDDAIRRLVQHTTETSP